MNWKYFIKQIAPCVVRIETVDGHGTGFLCAYTGDKSRCGIATAYHVIDKARLNEGTIKIIGTKGAVRLNKNDREILFDYDSDSAVIDSSCHIDLSLPEVAVTLTDKDQIIDPGSEVGWLGYPGIGVLSSTQCFFSGNISIFQEQLQLYCIDGVAINGVSGSPVFFPSDEGMFIIGLITAYWPNVVFGKNLPGLSVGICSAKILNLF